MSMSIVFENDFKMGQETYQKGLNITIENDAVAEALINAGWASKFDGDEEDVEKSEDETPKDEDEKEEDEDENEEKSLKAFEKALAESVKKTTKKLTQVTKRPNVSSSPRITVTEQVDPKGGFESFGHFAKCCQAKARGEVSASNKLAKHMSNMRTKAPMSAGGSHVGSDFVPLEWAKDILQLAFSDTVDLFSKCQQVPMSAQTLNLPAWVNTSAVAGVQIGNVAEGNALPESRGVTGNAQLVLQKFGSIVSVTDELERFSPYALDSILKQDFAFKMQYQKNDSIVNGYNGGVNLKNNASAVVVNRTTSNRLEYQDILNMNASLIGDFAQSACWLVNNATTPELYNLPYPNRAAATQIPAFANAGNFGNLLGAEPLGTLLNKPIYSLENVPALGYQGDLILVSFKAIAAAQTDTFIDKTPLLYFAFTENSYRLFYYTASVNRLTSPYTRKNGGSASNIVVLSGTASS